MEELNCTQIDEIVGLLYNLSKDEIYLLGLAICPDSIAEGFTKNLLIDTIEDVLLSRMKELK